MEINNQMNVTVLDTLYSRDVNNKIKEWKIRVEDLRTHSIMIYSYGYVDGKKVECNQIINSGKNLGKKNSTSHFEQAVLNAKSKWNKKISEGYNTSVVTNSNDPSVVVTNSNDPSVVTNSNNTSVVVKNCNNTTHVTNSNNTSNSTTTIVTFPMLANDYNKHKSKVKFPCFIQPKLDGYRMIYNPANKSCNSRQGKPFDIIKKTKLFTELQTIDEHFNLLDGELYLHGGVFEHLGILRKKKVSENDLYKLDQIEYHVYDLIDTNNIYKTRFEKLQTFFKDNPFTKIKLVQTNVIENETQLKQTHDTFVKNDYEGSIIRTTNGKYKCKARSSDLLKYKDFIDDEFEIVDYTFEIDTTSNDNLVVWVCNSKNGHTFNVRPKGTREERQYLYKRCQDDFNQFKNRKLHVKYFEMTENDIPRFPTTKSNTFKLYIRDVIE